MRPFALFVFAFLALAAAPRAQPVEVTHPVADFLRRLEEKGLVRPGFMSTLPRDAREVARVLAQAKAREAELGVWDRRRLDRFLEEFDPALRRAGTPLKYQDKNYSLVANFEYFTGGFLADSLPKVQGWTFGSFTPRVEGTFRDFGYLTAAATVGMERNRNPRFAMNYDPIEGMSYNTARGQPEIKSVSTFDGFRVMMGLGDEDIALEAGQDWDQWGPGHWQHATLGAHPFFWASDSLGPGTAEGGFPGTATTFYRTRQGYRYPGEGPPLPQIRLRMAGSRWEYVKVVAKRTGLSKDSAAYLIAHRLQLRLGNWTFGGTEMLVIGSHGIDEVLLIPGIPLKFAEHQGGDRDNSAISGDVEWVIPGHGRLYGELFLDDFNGLPLDFWGNKMAWMVGGSWQDPLGLPTELHLEYARVDPWVYTHHLYGTQMQNYGALLGSSLPPDAHAVNASAEFPLPGEMTGLVEWRFRQRDQKSRGTSLFDNSYMGENPEIKQFLVLDVETRNELSVSAERSWGRYLQVHAGAGGLWVKNFRGNPGASLATPTVFADFRLRY